MISKGLQHYEENLFSLQILIVYVHAICKTLKIIIDQHNIELDRPEVLTNGGDLG